MKITAEWFIKTVFREETIQRPQTAAVSEKTPPEIREARLLQNEAHRDFRSRASLFLSQGKLLADYEDDCAYECDVHRYYPTYQDFSNRELRAYFSWRTKLRRGNLQKTALSFAFLYIYELINQIGVSDPEDGYRKLKQFQNDYGQIDSRILFYLDRWMIDYVVYYALDPSLLEDTPQAAPDRNITVLEQIQEQDCASVMQAVKTLSPKWLERSRFYKAHQEDMDIVIVRVLRQVSSHYASRCRQTMVDRYCGAYEEEYVCIFESAVFCDPLERLNYEYAVNEQCVYLCRNGSWTVRKRSDAPRYRLDDLLKTIDAIMRLEYGDKHPLKSEATAKWLEKTIRKETQAFLAEKKAAEDSKISIDFSQLTQIRRDAVTTQEKLITEEEAFEPDGTEPQAQIEEAPVQPEASCDPLPLSQEERRLLHCLLYGGGTGWVQAEGLLLSVLADSINEKLYDIFQDSVLDDTPQLMEDYIDDLKEMLTL